MTAISQMSPAVTSWSARTIVESAVVVVMVVVMVYVSLGGLERMLERCSVVVLNDGGAEVLVIDVVVGIAQSLLDVVVVAW